MADTPFQIGMITIDCLEPRSLAAFWSQALGADVIQDMDGFFVMLGSTPTVAFQKVADPTPGKNRIHLDGGGGDRPAQVARLVALGATELETHEMPGFAWTVMADPDGNLFCVGNQPDQPDPLQEAPAAAEASPDVAPAKPDVAPVAPEPGLPA